MRIRRSDPPCIQRCNKECLLFNAVLAVRSFTPDFSDTIIYTTQSPQTVESQWLSVKASGLQLF